MRASLSDAEVARAVEKCLERDPGVDVSDLHVHATEGIVELTGTVGDLLSKRRAVRIAESVKGVRTVSDRLALVLKERSDSEIAKDVTDALLSDSGTSSLRIASTVDGATVTLVGTVKMHQQSDIAERVAEGIQGVRSVKNEIRVAYGSQPSDSEIETSVRSRLRWDMLVNDGLITVAVENGEVTLSGSVGSAAERRRAVLDSFVKGVRYVDDSRVEITWWAAKRDLLRNKPARVSDPEIRDAVRDALAYDPRVSAANVGVDVRFGFVTLRGDVGTPRAKANAESLAKRTIGVIQVNNELAVVPKTPVSDVVIESRARRLIGHDPHLELFEIGIRADHGSLTLTGTVDTAFDRAHATDVVSAIEGIRDVDNDLAIRRPEVARIHHPELTPYDPYAEPLTYLPKVSPRADAEIARDIRSELEWSPLVDATGIRVTVQSGIATLTGVVSSSAEREAAVENAYEGGASIVHSELEVRR